MEFWLLPTLCLRKKFELRGWQLSGSNILTAVCLRRSDGRILSAERRFRPRNWKRTTCAALTLKSFPSPPVETFYVYCPSSGQIKRRVRNSRPRTARPWRGSLDRGAIREVGKNRSGVG